MVALHDFINPKAEKTSSGARRFAINEAKTSQSQYRWAKTLPRPGFSSASIEVGALVFSFPLS
jgi:hypothetical protein